MPKLNPRHIAMLVLIACLFAAAFAATANASSTLSFHLVRKPPAVSRSTRAVFEMGRNVAFGVKSQTCRVDNQSWHRCRAWVGASNLKDGMHSFQGKLTMLDGRVASFTFRWMVDTHAPSVPAGSGGSDRWFSSARRTVSHRASTDGTASARPLTYHRRISTNLGHTWMVSPSAGALIVTRQGQTWVEYSASDAAGNTSAWSRPVKVKLDRTAPTAPSATGDPAWVSASSGTITDNQNSTDALSGVSRYQSRVSVNGEVWSAPTVDDQAAFTIANQGSTFMQFRSVDTAGNVSQWSTPSIVRLDNVAPTVPSDPTVTSATWAMTGVIVNQGHATDATSGVAGYEYRASSDSGSTWSTPSPVPAGNGITITAGGSTSVEVRAVDQAGNQSDWTNAAQVTVDRTPPTAPTLAAHSSGWVAGSATLVANFDSTDAHGINPNAYQYRTSTNGGQWSAPHGVSSHGTGDIVIGDEGTTQVELRSHDAAGNASDWSDLETVQVDNTPPPVPTVDAESNLGGQWVSTTASPDAPWYNGVSFEVSASQDNSGSGFDHNDVQTNTNDAGWVDAGVINTPDSQSTVVNDTGTTLVRARTCDLVGNCSAWTTPDRDATISIDNDAPTVPTIALGAGGTDCSSSSATFTFSSTDATSSIRMYWYQVIPTTGGYSDPNSPDTGFVQADANGDGTLTLSHADLAAAMGSDFDGHFQVVAVSYDQAVNMSSYNVNWSDVACVSGFGN